MSWLGRLFGSRALDRDLDRELRAHLELLTDDLVRSGLPRQEAMRQARLTLGGVEQVKEASRDARGTRFALDWWQDTRYALRALRRSPGFSAAAILTLAVGIGANTAVWSVLDALLLRALPVERSEELYTMHRGEPSDEDPNYLVSFPQMGRFQRVLPDSVRLGAMSSMAQMYVATDGQAEPVQAQLVSGNWFQVLEVGAAGGRGRVLGPGDDVGSSAHAVAVLSDGYWTRQFGRNPSVVGSTLRLNGVPLSVVGVAEPGFAGLTVGQPVDIWVPLALQQEVRFQGDRSSQDADTEQPWLPQDGVSWLTLVTRVPPGLENQVQARLDAQFHAELLEKTAQADSMERARALRQRLALEPLAKGFSPLRRQFGEPLWVLLAGVGLVLLIACANLASLLLARGAVRTPELALRVSLGARPGRLLRQGLTESLTLALLGGVASLAVAWWGGLGLLRLASSGPQPIPLSLSLDARLLGLAFLLALLTGILFGLAPALRAARTSPFGSFKTADRVAQRSLHRLPVGRMLVAAQLALSLVLVAGAGLFVRTLRNYLAIDTGFARERLVDARINPRAAGYTAEQLPALYQRLQDAIAAVPGVRGVGLNGNGLVGGISRIGGIRVAGVTRPPGWDGSSQVNFVSAGYFATVGMVLLRGREFTAADRLDGPKVAIVSQAMAKHFFGTEEVLGRRFGYNDPDTEIIGVVRDARVNALKQRPGRLIFRPLSQGPQEFVYSVEARTDGPPEQVTRAIRAAIAAVDPNLPVREVVTLSDLMERGLSREKLLARLAGVFSGLALLLAAIGLYGVMAYSVSQRSNEMGIRMALGAVPSRLWGLVVRDSLGMLALGTALGLLLWVPLQGLLRNLVFGLSPKDPSTLLFAAGVLAAIGVLATSLPAWRAARVDPARVLRGE